MVQTQPSQTNYQVIDIDPHFNRVVRYFRPSDYAVWAGVTATGPAFMLMMGKKINSGPSKGLPLALKISTVLSLSAGFLLAYQRSSLRFWGWTENSKEVQKDKEELAKLFEKGEPLYGPTHMSEFNQKASSWFSKYSALKFSAIPWFNFANHRSHGVDPKKYENN
ncbi:NADH-ubiquinone oxidoreductase complex I, 21 kDa subunit-domain-containing protein [Glomus cerebriforme]|uniref:NADH-ubiquinone oxidoreductase complex I, 21 kDa subunit-domain-containing protein n=1 Tax=Glomus cerebriforme TaxID=658196 RepID=A0A397TPZ2_9GLOM|nr:NADH-ubiquinone oxidoreductase complex I, 21 kDa subunit-domain-containing protein [Glomus cerebriforme]